MSNTSSTRLNKYISESGICSRREADRYIEKGNVLINGKKAQVGDQVFDGDRVTVNGNTIEPRTTENAIYLAFNKPVGIVSTTEAVKDNIVDYINHSERIFPIGRLDKDSQGLIFLTSNGDVVNKILRAGNKHEKEYLVTVNKPITDHFIEAMAQGVPMLGVMTKKCEVKKEAAQVFRITLVQGLNRQIRRMCEHFDYEVTRLERVRIMNITLKGLPVGDWRELTEPEMDGIFKAIEKSRSADDKYPAKSNAAKQVNKQKDKPENKPLAAVKAAGKPKLKAGERPFRKPGTPGNPKSKTKDAAKSAKARQKGKPRDRSGSKSQKR